MVPDPTLFFSHLISHDTKKPSLSIMKDRKILPMKTMLLFFDWKVTPYHLPMRSSSLVGGLRESHVLYKILLGSRSLSSTSISSTISWSPSSALSTSLSLSSVSTGNNRLGGYFSLICAESMIIFGLPPSTLHLILLHTDFIP